MSEHPRLPLVLGASRTALDRASLLLPGVILENAVHDAILAHRFKWSKPDQFATVFLDGVAIECARTRTPSGRKCWRPLAVRPANANERRTP